MQTFFLRVDSLALSAEGYAQSMGRWAVLELWSKLYPRATVLNINLVIVVIPSVMFLLQADVGEIVKAMSSNSPMTPDTITARWFLKEHSTPKSKIHY